MAEKKKKGKAKPGATVTRKVTKGPNKGDTVRFKANARGTKHPGKLVPKEVVKDVGSKNRSTLLTESKKTLLTE